MSKAIYIKPADVAKIVRKELKQHFGGTKFSVRTRQYTIAVEWTDGPMRDAVSKVVGHYHGCTFDGMIDLKSYVNTVDESGKEIHCGNDFISFQRKYSVEFLTRMLEETRREMGYEAPREVLVDRDGSGYIDVHDTGEHIGWGDMRDCVYKKANATAA